MCSDCAPLYASKKMRDCAGYVGGTQISRIANFRSESNNMTGVRGVYYSAQSGKYRARLKFQGKLLNLGSYERLEDAVKARKDAENRYFGEFLDSLAKQE